MDKKQKLREFYNDMTTCDGPILKYLEDDIPFIRWWADVFYTEISKVRVIIHEVLKIMEED